MNRWTVASAAALTGIAVVMLATVGGYGITWDEQFQSPYGELVIAWYRSGFHNDAALMYRDLFLYSGLFEVLAQIVARISPLDVFTDRHIVNVAFALIGLAGTWRLGVLVLGPRGGFLAMGLTALTPMFYGHSFNNPKDIPFAVLFVWTLCFLLESTRSFPDIRLSSAARLTASFGALLAIRPGGRLAVLTAAALDRSLRAPMPRVFRAAVAAATLAAAVVTAHDMAALHPYESVYFNRLVAGGLRGVNGRFEADWGNSYREGIEWVMRNVPGEGFASPTARIRFKPVTTCAKPQAPASFRFC